MGNGPVAADELRLLIERIERLEEEKKGIADDIKDVYGEAKSRGFCAKTMKRIIALRKLEPAERRELEAMLDVYKGALGMLDGTPLGNWAVEKLKKEAEEAEAATTEDEKPPAGSDAAPSEPPVPEPTIDDAKRLGTDAARAGKAVTANPFPPRDPRRAAWDEAWCQELGSDGMDIPDALRPAGKAKPAAEAAEQPASEAGADSEETAANDGEAEDVPASDEQFARARAFVIAAQVGSTSAVQRELHCRRSTAVSIVARLEREGVVSAPDHTGKRAVLIDAEGNRK